MGIKESIVGFYDKKYKLLLVFSIGLVLLSLLVLGINYARTGEFVDKGVSLKGGLTLTLPAETGDAQLLEKNLKQQFPKGDLAVRSITEAGRLKAFIIESADIDEKELVAVLQEQGFAMKEGGYSIEIMGSSLGKSFFRQTIIAVILAFIAMALVVLIVFRQPLPCIFLILAAASDIISTLAAVSVLGIKLTTAGIAALLMLVGYSVDTDILLTTKVLKRKRGTVFERLLPTVRTGMLMSLTSFAATMTAFLLVQSDIVKQIMLILSIGLLFDIIYTWCQNSGILRWYLERKEEKE